MNSGRNCRLTRETRFAKLREEYVVHQDQRIGLALGVLLLGAAGAFFFRNDAKTGATSPRLQTAKQLDAQIAEKSIAPYLQGIEEADEPRRTAARGVSDQGGPSLFPKNGSPLPSSDSPDLFLDDSREPFETSTQKPRSRQQPNGDDGIPDLAPIPIPETDEIISNDTAARREDSVGSASEGKLHVVQKGETLSSIAAKELGSTHRFIEIYEANRDQLKDANDVRVGMSLRMPTRSTAKTSKAVPSKSRSDLLSNSAPPLLDSKTAPNASGKLSSKDVATELSAPRDAAGSKPATGPSKRFVPAARPPLGTRVPSPQTDASDSKSQAGRRLSQRPPDEAGGKVAR